MKVARGAGRAERGDDDGSDSDESDGPPPITGPSLLALDDEVAGKFLNSRADKDDFWGTGVRGR